MVHGGTLAVHGRATAVVVATAQLSAIGDISRVLTVTAAPMTPLQIYAHRSRGHDRQAAQTAQTAADVIFGSGWKAPGAP